jgi:hypothetical protein
MKYRPTPLLVLSIGLPILGVLIPLFGFGGNFGGLALVVGIGLAAICFLLYNVSRKIFHGRLGYQVTAELVLLVVGAFVFYKSTGELMLHVPRHYSGYIIVGYEAKGKPKLPSADFFASDVHVSLPSSGILLTSSPRSKRVSFVVSSLNASRTIKAGYGMPYERDTLRCGNRSHIIDVSFVGDRSPGWSFIHDSTNRGIKKDEACSLLRPY